MTRISINALRSFQMSAASWFADMFHTFMRTGFLVFVCLFVTGAFFAAHARVSLQWSDVARFNPKLKILLEIKASKPFTISDLAMLADRKLIPADRDPGLVVGLDKAVFTTRISNWMETGPLPEKFSARLLTRFIMSGVYRVNFKIRQQNYHGPLRMEITAPRESFGRKLLRSDYVVRPEGKAVLKTDNSGNRWLFVDFERAPVDKTIRFHFQFKYLVDMAKLLAHDLLIFGGEGRGEIPDKIKPYLGVGYKIDPNMRMAVNWAAASGGGTPNAKREYERLMGFLKRNVVYDKRKRAQYFGGKSIYRDIDDMYQPADFTLSTQAGCCPDTILIECAFMRARGIPCRTVGRFGHFFSEMYVPGRGWMSTSVTPTGIPLVVSYGPDHLPYQNWKPKLRMQTSAWEARMRIEPLGDNERLIEEQAPVQAKDDTESIGEPEVGVAVDGLDAAPAGSTSSLSVEEDPVALTEEERIRNSIGSGAPIRGGTQPPPALPDQQKKAQKEKGSFRLLP
jgi:hypothetical protein